MHPLIIATPSSFSGEKRSQETATDFTGFDGKWKMEIGN
jgi:hypothetical protein